MRILFLYSETKFSDICWTLMELGHTVESMEHSFSIKNYIKDEEDILQEKLSNASYDIVVTYNFVPVISNVCEKNNTKYVSWVFDSPLFTLYTKEVKNKCNYIFIFDKIQYEKVKRQELEHVYYLPLGVNLSRVGAVEITKEDEIKYRSEISFIGQLYENNIYKDLKHYIDEEHIDKIEKIVDAINQGWNQNRLLEDYVDDELVRYLDSIFTTKNNYNISDNYFYGMQILGYYASNIDRISVLNTLGDNFDVSLYTMSNTDGLRYVNVHEKVDYFNEMNKIFYLSKINLNVTIRNIESGVPQRIFDIMGAGGFVLTNYQPEISELFEIDKEIVTFKNYDELIDKTFYYLTHERERIQIALNGYKRVRSMYSYNDRINYILDRLKE